MSASGKTIKRGVAAQLEAQTLDLVSRSLDEFFADLGRAGELILRTTGLSKKTSASTRAGPSTRFATPGGTPASARHANIWIRVSGVWSAGRLTTVQPAAIAAAIFRLGVQPGISKA